MAVSDQRKVEVVLDGFGRAVLRERFLKHPAAKARHDFHVAEGRDVQVDIG